MLSLLIVAFAAAYAVRGWRRGLMVEVVDLVGLIVALVLTALVWPWVGGLLKVLTPIGDVWATGLGVGVTISTLLAALFLASRWVGTQRQLLPVVTRRVDRVGGAVFASTWSVLLVAGLLMLAVTAPGARPRTAPVVCDSAVGRALITGTHPFHTGGAMIADLGRPVLLWVSQRLNDAFTLGHDPTVCDDLGQPVEGATGSFRFPAADAEELRIDPAAESRVLDLLNEARTEAGLEPLVADDPLADVGRAHARDMYLRGYFAHETPQCAVGPDVPGCSDPFDRIRAAAISYAVAGENLALAPTSETAHRGLMDSPGHRANILNPDFRRVGIGVVTGPLGLMVTQEFAG